VLESKDLSLYSEELVLPVRIIDYNEPDVILWITVGKEAV
jgi:hypothetical protein